ncbi:alpha/beta hydrolase [Paenibacillus sp. strain BS8-2]
MNEIKDMTSSNSEMVYRELIYREADGFGLRLHIYSERASSLDQDTIRDNGSTVSPSIVVFFFGGGWVDGNMRQFHPQCRFFASKGMIAIAAEYRVTRQHGSTPFDSAEDACAAISWIRRHAEQWGAASWPIIAAGGSAGGHLALCAAMFADRDDHDNRVSCKPDALLLFNPVVDTTESGFVNGVPRFGGRERELSPTHAVRPGLPPTLILHGTEDKAVPYRNVLLFQERMRAAGNNCELHTFEGRGHGFFNHPSFFPAAEIEDYEEGLKLSLAFICSLTGKQFS